MGVESKDQTLGIDNEVATLGFLELAGLVMNDPVLASLVKTWVVPGRSPNEVVIAYGDNLGSLAGAADACPAIELWPEPRDGQPLSNCRQQATLSVRVRILLAGNAPLSAINVWGRVQKAVYPPSTPEGNEVRRRLGALGFGGEPVLLAQPAITTGATEKQSLYTTAEGAFSASYRIQGS
jgi:hypothetical protein